MPHSIQSWRSLLTLSRASNLPTVWSNCLAAQWASGTINNLASPKLLLAASLLYTAGMFLNDAFDQKFDRTYRPERPIPAGLIPPAVVWFIGCAMLFAGTLLFTPFGPTTSLLACSLSAAILLYNLTHKWMPGGPIIMAACRSLLFLTVASTTPNGISGTVVWLSLALGAYIVGLSYIAKSESRPGVVRFWPCILLGTPIGLALILNDGSSLLPSIILMLGLAAWIAFSLQFIYSASRKNVGTAVSGLLAGIVWVDLLATAGASPTLNLIFPLLFLLARTFQKSIPAT